MDLPILGCVNAESDFPAFDFNDEDFDFRPLG